MLRGVVIDVRWPQAVQHVQEAIDGHEPVVTLEGHGRALTALLYPSLERRMHAAERLLAGGGYELALRTYGHDSETFRHRDSARIDVAPLVDSRGRRWWAMRRTAGPQQEVEGTFASQRLAAEARDVAQADADDDFRRDGLDDTR
jgi:hypothetical protein